MDRDNISIQTIIGVIFVIAALAIVPAVISVMTESVDNQVTTKSLVEEASYIIYKDGDYSCLKNGTTGRIELRSADDRLVIQSALDVGGIVYIAPGTYEITESLNLTTGSKLIGAGVDSVIEVTAATDINAVVLANDSEVRGLFIDGNSGDQVDGGLVTSQCGIRGANVTNVTISNVHISDVPQLGINIHGYSTPTDWNTGNTAVVTIEKSVIVGTGNSGIKLDSCRYGSVTDNTLLDTGKNGIELLYSRNINIDGNKIDKVTYGSTVAGYGIAVSIGCMDAVINGNTIRGCSNSGITLDVQNADADPFDAFITVSNNIVYENTLNGIVVNHAMRCIVTGNVVHNNTNAGILLGYAPYTIVDGNSISYSTSNNVYIAHDSNYSVVSNNVIKDGKFHGIMLDYGSHILITGNVIVNHTVASKSSIYLSHDCDNNTISNNFMRGAGTGGRGIYIQYATCENNRIISNTFEGYFYKCVDGVGTGNFVENNINWKTENSGSAVILNGQTYVTVTHGLSATPTSVIVTSGTGATYTFFVSNAGATSFRINANSAVSGNQTVYWYAEV